MIKHRTLILLLLLNVTVLPNLFSQIAVNATGILPDTSAMLDISSTNKGFLLPRMSTAQRDAIILPATGLSIFNSTTSTVDINIGIPAGPVWSPLSVQGLIDTSSILGFYSKVRSELTAGIGITYNNGTGVISNSGVTSVNGSTGAINVPFGNLTETGSTVLTITGGTNAVIGGGIALQMKPATGSQDGFLSAADWTAFNTKGSGTVSNIATGYGLSGGTITATGTIIVDSAALSLKYLRISDTANIRLRPVAGTNITITGTYPNLTFNASGGLGLGTVTSVATTAPLTGGTFTTAGIIGITQANASANGYLSSTDWNTFNGKGNGTVTGVSGTTNRVTSTVGANPVIDISSLYAGQASITTLGSITTGTWNATAIAVLKGGTGLTATTQGDIFYGAGGTSAFLKLPKSTLSTRYLSNTGGSNNPAWAQINLSNGVTGDLNVANLNGGSSATINTYWRGDGQWAPANQMPVATQTGDYIPTDADYTIVCDNSAAMSIFLPSAVGIAGRVYIIKKISDASVDVTVTPNMVETIDGLASQLLSAQYSRITIQSDGANWIILSN